MMAEVDFEFAGVPFKAVDRALYQKDEATLILADVHLGKATHFRKEGLPVPQAVEEKNLERIDRLIASFRVKQVIFLGDLFHSEDNTSNAVFAKWLEAHPEIDFILVEGNHDLHNSFQHKDLKAVDEHSILGIGLYHEPQLSEERPYICGHIHPAVRFLGKARQRLTLPAFVYDDVRMVLPAFGEFTGTHALSLSQGMQAIPVLPDDHS